MGEDAALRFLHRAAASPDVMTMIPNDAGAVEWARRLAGVDFNGPVEDMLEEAFADERIPRATLQSVIDANLLWGKDKADSRGGKRAAVLQDWLSRAPSERAALLPDLHRCWSTAKGDPQISTSGHTPITEVYAEHALEMFNWTGQIIGEVTRAQYADRLARALSIGKEFAAQYSRANTPSARLILTT